MSSPDNLQQENQGHGLRWHATRIVAAFGIGFCVFLIGTVIGLFVAGPDFVVRWFNGLGVLAMWVVAIAALPFVYRRLR
jgi:hypothetical protein